MQTPVLKTNTFSYSHDMKYTSPRPRPPYRGITSPLPSRSPSPCDSDLLQWRPSRLPVPAERISPQCLREHMICEQSSRANRSTSKASKLLGAEARILLHPQPLSFPHPLIEYNPLLDTRLQEAAQPTALHQQLRSGEPYCRFRAAQRCRRSGVLFRGRPCDCELKHERRFARDWETTPCESSWNHETEHRERACKQTRVRFVEGEISQIKVVDRWIEEFEHLESEGIDAMDYAMLTGFEADADIAQAEVAEGGEDDGLPFVEDEVNWLNGQEMEIDVVDLDEQGIVDGVGTLDLGLP